MSLTEYRRKRVFKNTPEPAPETPAKAAAEAPQPPPDQQDTGGRFFVQRHQARRLHYDLRLEAGGVLKSWAVPKGPTLDPKEKRLAMHVEDHPLDYGNFEGTIPEGNYGAGAVSLWDRGTYELAGDKKSFQEQMERGDLKFRLHGEKLMGEYALVRMKNRGKGNEWLLLKKPDFAAQPGWDAEDQPHGLPSAAIDPSQLTGAVKAEMPSKINPMLALLSKDIPEGADWLYEVKWDGWRAICFISGGKLRMVSRNGNVLDRHFPEFAGVPQHVAANNAILDAEVVALNEQGRPSFQHLQNRIGLGTPGVKRGPVVLFAFDLIYFNGYDLRKVPLVDRKRLLAAVIRPNPLLRNSDHFTGSGRKLYELAKDQGLEGIVAKRALSAYESRRNGDWLKIKIVCQQDFVVCGYTRGERELFGSLVLGYYQDGKLLYAGNVGSGFDQQTLRSTFDATQPLVSKKNPLIEEPDIPQEITWLKPELVCEVKFSSWTDDKRVRAPVFLGLRSDVSPKDVVREEEQKADLSAASPRTGSANDERPVSDDRRRPRRSTSKEESANDQRLTTNDHNRVRPPLLTGTQSEVMQQLGAQRLKFTNLNKVFYPQEGYSKRDVINFYYAVSDLILPYLKDRPLSLKRYPNGIQSEFFFQKNAREKFAPWVRTEPVVTEPGKPPTNFVIANDVETLVYLANLGCIDQNPWMSRIGSLDQPDFILLDLDPHDCSYDRIVEAAQLVRSKLQAIKLEGYPKTTGGDGMHVYVPLDPVYTYDQVRIFAEVLSRVVVGERPDLFTTPRTVSKRQKGKVYFDYLQIGEGKTISAPYVLRAYPGAPVATPLRWSEVVPGLKPEQFHLGNVLDRFARLGDLFVPVLTSRQRLEPALERLGKLVREQAERKTN